MKQDLEVFRLTNDSTGHRSQRPARLGQVAMMALDRCYSSSENRVRVERVLSAACAGLRGESTFVQEEGGAAVDRALTTRDDETDGINCWTAALSCTSLCDDQIRLDLLRQLCCRMCCKSACHERPPVPCL